jgi:hypothetical protein
MMVDQIRKILSTAIDGRTKKTKSAVQANAQ